MRLGIKNNSSKAAGHVLMATLVVAGVLGIALAAYLNVLSSHNSYTVRSQVWNACMPVVEAGLEEALAHINDFKDASWNDNGWEWNGEAFIKQRWFGGSYFNVSISTNTGSPVITSTGSIPAPVTVGYGTVFAQLGGGTVTNYISRTVRVTTIREPLLTYAMLAKQNIDFSGNNCNSDSYNSDFGPYSSQTPGEKGDIGTNWRGPNAINANNANVKGHLASGAGSTVKVGPNSTIGSAPWVNTPTPGIESGWWTSDLNVDIPDVQPPWSGGGALVPTSQGPYKYWMDSGNYELNGDLTLNSSDQMYVNGNVTLWVKGDVKIMGGTSTISTPGSLRIFISGTRGIFVGSWIKSVAPADLQIFGLPSCTTVWIATGTKLEAVIDTPQADVLINGTGELFGAAVVKSVKFTGSAAFHYDEALLKLPIFKPYHVGSWEEI